MATSAQPSHAPPAGTPDARWPLFLASALVLLLELALIRWLPSHVLYLTFFTNTVLLASFLGMSVGCLLAPSHRELMRVSAPVLLLLLALGLVADANRHKLRKLVDVGNQASPEMVFFGAEPSNASLTPPVPIELLNGAFFLLVALALMGPGQLMGRWLGAMPERLRAYSWNVAGSCAGIAIFTLAAWLQLPPVAWFALVAALATFLCARPGTSAVRRLPEPAILVPLLLAVAASVPTSGVLPKADRWQHWSPYYRVDFELPKRTITVNLIGHQTMVPLADPASAYAIPHLLRRDAGLGTPGDVLVIGAGSGNDVARSLQWGATSVHAVDIDPYIQHIGASLHPDRPYADPRVRVTIDDGRHVLSSTDRKYDLVVFALVDSLVLHSSYSNIRLESYLFTEESLRAAKERLKPGGMLAVYNFFRQGWIIGRLERTLSGVFGAPPLVIGLPSRKRLGPEDGGGFTLLLAGEIGPISERFASRGPFLIAKGTPLPDMPSGWPDVAPPKGSALAIEPSVVEMPEEVPPAKDDWPFLYLRSRTLPSLTLRGMAVMAFASLLLVLVASRGRPGVASEGRMLLLGAGFMLVESSAVVQMALLFGSTWMVNALVFMAILLLILVANAAVARLGLRGTGPAYAALLGALALRVAVPLSALAGLSRPVQVVLGTGLVLLPILFAGVVFALSFRDVAQPERALAANVLGAMLGGLAENASMIVGFRLLAVIAMLAYAGSAAFGAPASRRS